MKAKKTTKADLNNKRGLFFLIGLSVSLLLAIGVLTTGQSTLSVETIEYRGPDIEEEKPPISIKEQEPVKPMRQIVVQSVFNAINIRPDHQKINTSALFPDVFDDLPVFKPVEIGRENPVDDGGIVDVFAVTDQPLFRGEDVIAFHAWVMQHVKYPAAALANGVQGRVIVQFVIDRDGKLSQIEVLSSPDRSLSEEAVRILSLSSDDWTPGKQRGRPVAVRFTIPMEFRLNF